jgi:hypothetical protein
MNDRGFSGDESMQVHLLEQSVGSRIIVKLDKAGATRELHFELVGHQHWSMIEQIYNILSTTQASEHEQQTKAIAKIEN